MLVRNTGVAEGNIDGKTPSVLKTAKRVLTDFGEDRSGNIIFLFAIMATVLFLFAGGAVDYTRWNAVRADMIESMDASSLALAQLAANDPDLTDSELKEYGRKFFEANFKYENSLEPGWDIVFTLDDEAVVDTCVSGKIDTYLLGVAGIHKLNINKCVEVTKKGSGRVELALVLDVTGSMDWTIGGKRKIESLRDAVDELLEVMYGDSTTSNNLKIGIVPFNAYVNPGGATSWNSTWGDLGANAYYHGARFIHVDEDGEVDMDTKVNHYNLFDSVPGSNWMGCVEARPYPLDELDVPPSGTVLTSNEINTAFTTPSDYTASGASDEDDRSAEAFDDAPNFNLSMSQIINSNNFRWVPMFAEDGIDCDANWRGRCPYYYNNSYWTRTESFTINGSNHSQEVWRNWFVDPSYDGRSEGDYYNRSFLNDEEYIGRYSGEALGRYGMVVEAFQALDSSVTPSGALTSDQQEWRDMMEAFGVNEFKDPDISSSNDGSTVGYDEYILRHAYVGWWDPSTETYEYKYDLNPYIDESVSDSDSYMVGPNRSCPTEVLPLTSDRSAIETHMQRMFPMGNTNSANGAMWGWRLLSDEAPFTEGVGPGDANFNDWQKAIVIMTDGSNTTSWVDTHFGSDLTSYGYAVESRMGENMTSTSDMRDEYDNKLLRICHRMKQEGYLIYTIMFGLESNSTERVFKACATKPTAPYFQDADNGADLEEAFGDIAADLVDLHISK